jgi:RsmE family RNA methyltransferase
MNIILFDKGEESLPLALSDKRSLHIMDILKLGKGSEFRAGLINGPIGSAVIDSIDSSGIHFTVCLKDRPPDPYPLTVIIGLVRPLTAQRLLKDLTAMGVQSLHFIVSRMTEKSYASSHLWTKCEYRHWLVEGAQQTKTSLLPVVHYGNSLKKTLHLLTESGTRILLDPGGPRFPLSGDGVPEPPAIIAVGPERGFTADETDIFTEFGFTGYSLMDRTLRTETAAIAGTALLLSSMGVN